MNLWILFFGIWAVAGQVKCPDGSPAESAPFGSPSFLIYCGVKESSRLSDAPKGVTVYSRLEIFQGEDNEPVFRSERESWVRVVKRSLEIQEVWWLGQRKGPVLSQRVACGAKQCRLEVPRCAKEKVHPQFPKALVELRDSLAKGPSPRPLDRLVAEVLVEALAGNNEAVDYFTGPSPDSLPPGVAALWTEAAKDLERLEKLGCLRQKRSSSSRR